MRTRIITGAIAFSLFLPVLIFSDTWAYSIVMAMLAVIGCIEMMKCLGTSKVYAISAPVVAFAGAMPLLVRGVYRLGLSAENAVDFIAPYDIVIILTLTLFLWLCSVAVFWHKKATVETVALTFFTVTYITLGFTSMVLIRDYDLFDGKWMFLVTLIGSWITDIFAYFGGRAFGKHKLSPEISPKKTIEGSVCGVISCIATVILYGFILSRFTDFEPNYILLAACGMVSSVVSQVGDLLMSVIKRKFGIKDYGKVLPGHGGVVDRFDSVIAVAISLYLLLFAVEKIGLLF